MQVNEHMDCLFLFFFLFFLVANALAELAEGDSTPPRATGAGLDWNEKIIIIYNDNDRYRLSIAKCTYE